jgi:hypothetical protein
MISLTWAILKAERLINLERAAEEAKATKVKKIKSQRTKAEDEFV